MHWIPVAADETIAEDKLSELENTRAETVEGLGMWTQGKHEDLSSDSYDPGKNSDVAMCI